MKILSQIFTPLIAKILTPFLQLFFLVISSVGAVAIYQSSFELLYFSNFRTFDNLVACGTSLLFSGALLMFSNTLIILFERNRKISVVDHVRQSFFFYALFLYFAYVFPGEILGGEYIESVFRSPVVFNAKFILLYAIFLNASFLYLYKKYMHMMTRSFLIKIAMVLFALPVVLIVVVFILSNLK